MSRGQADIRHRAADAAEQAPEAEPRARSRRRRDQQRAETRERIFQAAIEEFLRVGFSAAQIPTIAQAAGVVRGTFYFHFPSKEHVLKELAARSQAETAVELRTLRGSGASVREVLRQLVAGMTRVQDSLGEANLLRDMLSMYVRAPLDDDDATSRAMPLLEELMHQFEIAAERGELRDDVSPEQMAISVLTSIFGHIVAWRRPGFDRASELQLMMDILLEGIKP